MARTRTAQTSAGRPVGTRTRRGAAWRIILPRRVPVRRLWAATHWLSLTALALVLALTASVLIPRPPGSRISELALDLALAGAVALVLFQVGLRVAGARRIARVRARLAIPPLLTALVIAVTVISLAQAMFISPEDSVLLLVILGFALLVAPAFAGSLAGEIARSIARVETGSRRVAEGDSAFRVSD